MQLFAGASIERPPGPKYTAELRFAELAPSGPLPKTATLRRWRSALPDGFELALRAPEACWNPPEGPLRAGSSLDEARRWLVDAAAALEASMVVVATGAAVTTGARDRERLRAYVRDLSLHEGCALVWQPSGLWEPDATRAMARSLGVIGAFDAVDDPVPPGELIYGSLRAEGLRRSFSHAELADVLAKLEASDASRAFVSIDSPQSFREARLLQALSEGRA